MIVKEYTTASGVKVFFHDDAYAECTEEELERRRRQLRDAAWNAVRAGAASKLQKSDPPASR